MKHERAWRVDGDDDANYGVLVECGPRKHPYWWVLCPAAATLHLDSVSVGCSDSTCLWDDVHRKIVRLWRDLDSAGAARAAFLADRAAVSLPIPAEEPTHGQ